MMPLTTTESVMSLVQLVEMTNGTTLLMVNGLPSPISLFAENKPLFFYVFELQIHCQFTRVNPIYSVVTQGSCETEEPMKPIKVPPTSNSNSHLEAFNEHKK